MGLLVVRTEKGRIMKTPRELKKMVDQMAAVVAQGGSVEDAIESAYLAGVIDGADRSPSTDTTEDADDRWYQRHIAQSPGPTCAKHIGESLDPEGACWSCFNEEMATLRQPGHWNT